MKTIGRIGIVMTALLSLLLVAGCSDGKEVSCSTSLSSDKKTLEFRFSNGVTMKLVRIEAGTFTMGPPQTEYSRGDGEGPQHQVTLSAPFHMGVTEVTQAQWRAVMNTEPWKNKKRAKARDDHAASYISWDDATAFCAALSKKTGQPVRLPTEAEWEYACRAGTTTAYCFGIGSDWATLGDYAWCRSNTGDKNEQYPHPVGVKKPNAWGLYDMHGNVCEWCSDWYADSYGSADARNPKGPAIGQCGFRVLRGGAWNDYLGFCRAAYRYRGTPDLRGFYFGFRVVVESDSGAE